MILVKVMIFNEKSDFVEKRQILREFVRTAF